MTELYSTVSVKNCSFNHSKKHISSSYAFIAARVDVITLVQFIHMPASSSKFPHGRVAELALCAPATGHSVSDSAF